MINLVAKIAGANVVQTRRQTGRVCQHKYKSTVDKAQTPNEQVCRDKPAAEKEGEHKDRGIQVSVLEIPF